MVQDALGSAYQVRVQSITKNNNTRLDGLTILTDELNISPTIYLNHYYRQYEHGKTAEQICEEILAIYRDNCPASNIDISFFTDYDKLKDHIIFKLVHYERNKNLLECVPYIRFLDLALVFCCLVDASPSGTATILIYHQHLQLWHLDRDTLYQLATKIPRFSCLMRSGICLMSFLIYFPIRNPFPVPTRSPTSFRCMCSPTVQN